MDDLKINSIDSMNAAWEQHVAINEYDIVRLALENIINNTPNDTELGNKIRELYGTKG